MVEQKQNLEAKTTDAVSEANEAASKKKPVRTIPPVYRVMMAANRQFKRYSKKFQNTEAKIACIEDNIDRYYDDSLRFWANLKDEAKDLLDSIKFNNTCNGLGLKPENVAQHIIFEGKGVKNRVLWNGLDEMGELIKAFDAPLFEDKDSILEDKVSEN